jgi:hypothetical protein
MQSAFITLADMQPKMETLGRGNEFTAILDDLRDTLIAKQDLAEPLQRLKLFAYSLGPTDESMEIIVVVWGWEKINKQIAQHA